TTHRATPENATRSARQPVSRHLYNSPQPARRLRQLHFSARDRRTQLRVSRLRSPAGPTRTNSQRKRRKDSHFTKRSSLRYSDFGSSRSRATHRHPRTSTGSETANTRG